ncbi:MAG TPA: hypothetical protein VGQ52_10290 [Gemmatimonadaceae bacterium]|nr:hypothetical protein [Gemmatimonadaceae bacterium]
MIRKRGLAMLAVTACACASPPPNTSSTPSHGASRFLYVWAGDKDEKDPDFVAVYDVRPSSKTYGQVLSTTPVGMSGSLPHHLEYVLPPSGQLLFANGHHHEAIMLFDVSDAEHPRLVRTLDATPGLRFPHDFARLPNGHVLIGFLRSDGPSPLKGDSLRPGGHGGLAEFEADGRWIRSVSAADSTIAEPIRLYAFALLPEIDRLVTTSAPMMEDFSADVVQIWRLSDYKLLRTLRVPEARLPDGTVLKGSNGLPFEPRVLPDKRSVFLNAYRCGFYHLTGLETANPALTAVYAIDTPPDNKGACGVPVVVGNYWIMTVGRANSLVTLDISDPAHPKEVARLYADSIFRPHWLAKDPGSDRLIVGAENGGEERMLLAHVDPATGKLRWDTSLRGPDGLLGISFKREQWPHGRTGEAFGHAALFRP